MQILLMQMWVVASVSAHPHYGKCTAHLVFENAFELCLISGLIYAEYIINKKKNWPDCSKLAEFKKNPTASDSVQLLINENKSHLFLFILLIKFFNRPE